MNTFIKQPFLFCADQPKTLRALLLFFLIFAAVPLRAAEDPVMSKVATNSLPEVLTVMETYRTQARTNVALRPFVSGSPSFSCTEVRDTETSRIHMQVCDCGTLSACYEITATSVSPKMTRIEVRSLDVLPDKDRAEFRPKRNARVMEELMRLLEKKP